MSSPWISVNVATLLTDSFLPSVSLEQSSFMLVKKENALFLGDFHFLGSVILERVAKLSVGNSSGLSFRTLEEMKCLLQTLIDIPRRKFFLPILCIHSFSSFLS